MPNNPLMTFNKQITIDNIFNIDTSKINDNNLLSLIEKTKEEYRQSMNDMGYSHKPETELYIYINQIIDKLRELYDPNNNLKNDELLNLVIKQKTPPESSKKNSGYLTKNKNYLPRRFFRRFFGGKYTKKSKCNSNKLKTNKRKSNKKR
jgi:hypothetical protein